MSRALVVLVALSACGDDHHAVTDAPVPIDAQAIDAGVDAALSGCGTAADCADGELCLFAPQHACGLDRGRGACKPVESQLCPDLAFWVCGCDGQDYVNQCVSHAVDVDVDYGGPCRPAGTFVPCATTADCPTDLTFHQFCVDDPRDTCDPSAGDTGCAGACVHANQTCSDSLPCPPTGSTAEVDSPDTEACVALADPAADADPGACVYTTRLHCASAGDCGTGELCLPDFACSPGEICQGWCVRP